MLATRGEYRNSILHARKSSSKQKINICTSARTPVWPHKTLGSEQQLGGSGCLFNIFQEEALRQLQEAYRLGAGDSLVFGRLPSGDLVACGKLGSGRRRPSSQPVSEKIVVTLDRTRRRRKAHTPYDPSVEGGAYASQAKAHKEPEQEMVHPA